LSFQEKQELEALPVRIDAIEQALSDLHAAMADPAFYRKDRDEIARASKQLEDLERELAAAYERWHALEQRPG
jgi:ATP-binding cassette subfamily F protein uup